MNTIKFYKKDKKNWATVNGERYRGYTVSKLPKHFGEKFYEDVNDDGDLVQKVGDYQWFNYKGLTYIHRPPSFWEDVADNARKANVDMLFDCMN